MLLAVSLHVAKSGSVRSFKFKPVHQIGLVNPVTRPTLMEAAVPVKRTCQPQAEIRRNPNTTQLTHVGAILNMNYACDMSCHRKCKYSEMGTITRTQWQR